jgi:N-methylhydantoinase B
VRQGSAGAGRFRGGHGVEAAFTLRQGEAYLTLVGDRAFKGAYGLHGGHDGAPADHDFTVGGEAFKAPHLSKIDKLYLRQGDGVFLRTPGGGGYGDPAGRNPAAVARDRENGYLGDES